MKERNSMLILIFFDRLVYLQTAPAHDQGVEGDRSDVGYGAHSDVQFIFVCL